MGTARSAVPRLAFSFNRKRSGRQVLRHNSMLGEYASPVYARGTARWLRRSTLFGRACCCMPFGPRSAVSSQLVRLCVLCRRWGVAGRATAAASFVSCLLRSTSLSLLRQVGHDEDEIGCTSITQDLHYLTLISTH